MHTARKTATPTLLPVEGGAIFVSLELSRSIWLVTALATPLGSQDVETSGAWRGSARVA